MAAEMNLRYVVITSVNRDDLEDGGSRHFAATVREVRRALPQARVEVLTPDFCGDHGPLPACSDAAPHVFNHNLETVPRLYRRVRPQADYRQSLGVLAFARRYSESALTKSGFMVGLGETEEEVRALLRDLRAAGADVVNHQANTSSPRAVICRWPHTSSRTSFEAYRDYGWRWVFAWCSVVRWSAVPTGPDAVSRRGAPVAVLNWLLALMSAALLVLCFPRFQIAWLAPVALAPLLIALARRAEGRSAVSCWAGAPACLLVRRLLLDPVRALVPWRPRNLAGWAVFPAVLLRQGVAHGRIRLAAGILIRRWWRAHGGALWWP